MFENQCFMSQNSTQNYIKLTISIILNDSIPFEPSGLKTSIKDCIPSSIDQYILFNNEKFLIEDSVLTYIQKLNALCPEIKDNFTRWQ